MDDARVKAFRLLKPPCVELSQVALRLRAKKATGKDIVKSTEGLYLVLREVCKQANALDVKLADYVFFPLSHVFRESHRLPARAVEFALEILEILISCGWRSNVSPDLGKQLLILLSFLAGGSAVEAKTRDVNEELGAVAFKCLTSLFNSSIALGSGARGSVDSESVPVFGHAIMVVLDGVTGGPSIKVRLAALEALDGIIAGTSDEEALRHFFPGIVSSLTKTLSPENRSRNSHRILEGSLYTLNKILCKVIKDERISHPALPPEDITGIVKKSEIKLDSWLKATSAQVKLALANIVPLRYHERSEVQIALFQLCVSVLRHCRRSLDQSTAMVVETLAILCSRQLPHDDNQKLEIVQNIFATDLTTLDLLKNSLHDWVVALPRIMQSNDEVAKRRSINQVSTAFQIIAAQGIESDILNISLALNLRSSVSAVIQSSSSPKVLSISGGSLEVTQLLQSTAPIGKSISFSPVLFSGPSQKYTMTALHTLAQQVKNLPMSAILREGIVETLRTTSEDDQLASLWICLQLSEDASPNTQDVDQYLNIPPDPQDAHSPLLEDVYLFSLDILARSTYEEKTNWRLQALSLEVIAVQARRQKQDFRPELVDTLYPILERMGSNNTALQQHATTTLNLVSTACAYQSPSALIIANVDYLVNAVALKLNTFDISPQAPQVLVMMVQLCGHVLIPYLDDLVESIFSILACFHGYPALVESLFSVLHAIVEQGSKAPARALTPGRETARRKPSYNPISIATLTSRLASSSSTSSHLEPLPESPLPEPDSTGPPPEPSPLPLSKPQTILSQIATLTPPHLTSPSPSLRRLLLTLLPHTFPPLSTHPDTFLPLAATLYPVLYARLQDPEPYVVTSALLALTSLISHAGDFLTSRISDSWLGFREWYWKAERAMRGERKVMGARVRGPKYKVWDAWVRLLVGVVEWVGVEGEMEDEVFEMLGVVVWGEGLGEGAGSREEVREVLRGLNEDAFWMEERRRIEGGGTGLEVPVVEGLTFSELSL